MARPKKEVGNKRVPYVRSETAERDEKLRARARIVLVPTDESTQNILAHEMVEFVMDKDIYCLEDFPISKSMAPSKFYAIGETNEFFAQGLNLARYIIASRLQNQWRDKKLEKEYALRMLPLYHREYYEFSMLRVKNEAEGKEAARLTVVLDKVESSPLVPNKK